jgi:hypothetical protein
MSKVQEEKSYMIRKISAKRWCPGMISPRSRLYRYWKPCRKNQNLKWDVVIRIHTLSWEDDWRKRGM